MLVTKKKYNSLERKYLEQAEENKRLKQAIISYKENLEEVAKINLQKKLEVYNPQNTIKLDIPHGWNSYGFNLEEAEKARFIEIVTRLSDLCLICA